MSHGLEPKRESGTVRVHLYEREEVPEWSSCRRDAENCGTEPEMCQMLHICVEDDGVGFDTEKLTENVFDTGVWDEKAGHTHTGLENTKRILQILYDGQHIFRVSGGKGKGTKIEIILLAERGGESVEDHSRGR